MVTCHHIGRIFVDVSRDGGSGNRYGSSERCARPEGVVDRRGSCFCHGLFTHVPHDNRMGALSLLWIIGRTWHGSARRRHFIDSGALVYTLSRPDVRYRQSRRRHWSGSYSAGCCSFSVVIRLAASLPTDWGSHSSNHGAGGSSSAS